jgi:uncharacterized membrane protein (DUF373 family)
MTPAPPARPDADDAGISEERREARRERARVPLVVVEYAEDLVHYAIAALLLVIAGYVVYETISEFLGSGHPFATRVTGAINGVLFVIIVLELLRTALAHFETSTLQLEPFLIIGIISAVRHILTIGARLRLQGEGTAVAFEHSQIELGVETAVVVGLSVGLLLVRRRYASDPVEA